MSARSDLVEVSCDGPASGGVCPRSAAMADYGTARRVREILRSGENPWRTGLPGGVDRCGDCQAQTNPGSNSNSSSAS